MKNATDAFMEGSLTQDELDHAVGQQGTEAGKGMRSATLGMRSSLRNAMGAASEGLGYNDYAQENYAAADELGKRAANAAPRVGRLRDVNSAGDFGDWAAGTLGALVPSAAVGIGAGLVSGGAAVPAMLAGTAAYAPLEIGDAIGRQREAGQPVDGLRATMGGLASAAGQSIVPGIISAKLVGKTAGAAATAPARSLRSSIGAGGVEGMALEGASEAGGEYAKQLGSTQTLDTLDHGAALDAAAAGALGGGVMGGVGGAAEYAHRNAGRAGQGLSSAADAATGFLAGREPTPDDPQGSPGVLGRVKGALGAGKDAAAQQMDALAQTPLGKATTNVATQAGETLDGYELPDKFSRLWKSGKASANAGLEQIANNEDVFGDPVKFAADLAKTGKDKLVDLFKRNDDERQAFVKSQLDELSQEDLTPEDRATLSAAAGDLYDRNNQTTVVGIKRAREASKAARTAIATSLDRMGKFFEKHAQPKDGTVKKSEMRANDAATKQIESAVREEILPVMQEVRPELFDKHSPENTQAINQLAGRLRGLVGHIADGKPIDSDVLLSLMEVSNGRADELVDAAYRAVGKAGDKKQTAAFFRSLNQIAEVQRSNNSLLETMQASLVPGLQGKIKSDELRTEAAMLQRWAEHARKTADDERTAYGDRKVRDGLTARYGTKVDAVLAAVEAQKVQEQNMLESRSVKLDEEGNVLSQGESALESEFTTPDGGRQIVYGGGPKGANLMMADEHDENASQYGSAAMQKLNKLKAANSSTEYRWASAEDLGESHPWTQKLRDRLKKAAELEGLDPETYVRQELPKYGAWTTEKTRQDTQVSWDEVDAMRVDKAKHRDSPARIDTGIKTKDGELSLDAVKMTKAMQSRFGKDGEAPQWTAGDDKGTKFRMARMFIEAAAAAQEHIAQRFDAKEAFQIPDSTVIGYVDKQPFTFGEARKLDPRNERDKAYDADTMTLVDLREQFRTASGLDPKTGAKVASGKTYKARKEQDAVREKARDITSKRELAVMKDQTRDDNRAADEDALDFTGEIQRGIAMNKVRMREIEAELFDLDNTTKEGKDRERELMEEFGRLSLARTASTRSTGKDLGSGQREVDPFGQIHQATGFSETREPAPIDRDKSNQAPGLLGVKKAPPTAPDLVDKLLEVAKTKLANLMSGMDPPDTDTVNIRARGKQYTARQLSPGVIEVYNDRGDVVAREGSTPSPKAAAAKKAALQKAASSGDPALLKELSTSTDAKGLMRAIRALAEGEAADANTRGAIDTAQDRLGELMRADEDVAYGMLLDKKYSLLATQIHEATGNPGFAATHDSPIKHEGKFDWRSHSGKGEGIAAFGAGTYLSTANGVHKFYKGLFTAKVQANGNGAKSPTYEVSVGIPHDQLMNWDKPLRAQSKTVEKILKDAGEKLDLPSEAAASGKAFYGALANKLGSQAAASDYLQSLGILGHEYAAAAGKGITAPNYVIYDDSKITTNYVHFDRTRATGAQGPVDRRAVYQHLKNVLGPQILVAWRDIAHAGEFERVRDQQGMVHDVIRLSIHSLNPMSTAYHESLHAFFQRLTDLKQGNVMDVLERAGNSASVMNQLKHLLKDEPAALKQLNNAEERAAYMYQFWATGQLKVGPETRNTLQKIADFIRSVLGIWSNDERALHIMQYFKSGEFATDSTARVPSDAVQRKLMEPGRNKALQMAKRMTSPALDLGEALMSAGGTRLRSTGIPALRELADAMKLHGTSEGVDPGFVPAARREHVQRMNALATKLKGTSETAISAALQSLQTKSNDAITALATPEDRLKARQAKAAFRQHLDDAFDYMRAAGVDIDDLGYGNDYFPRVYDAAFISAHQQEFNAVLRRHDVSDPQSVANKIMVTGGAEFTVETDKPGMQHMKLRKLKEIPDAELAPFMVKDPLTILNNYTSQATRRAEWARRFGDDGKGVTRLLAKAHQQGATGDQLETAQNFIRSVDGTLGDTIDPEARRLMGNMIVYQNIRLLPLAIFSSVVDPMGVLVRGGTVGDAWSTFSRGVKEAVKPFKKTATDDDMTQLAQTIGVIEDSALMHTMSALYMQGMAGDTARKINDTFFRYNLMEQWNTSVRVGAMQAAMAFLKRHNDGTASKHSQRWLNELGLQPGQVKLDAQGNVDARDPRMAAAINRWVDGAVLRPDATDSAIWMSDPHFALIAHMKKFVFAFHETILKRVAHEYTNGNFAPVMAMGGYVPIMIAADLMKGLIQGGGDEPEWKKGWTAGDYLWSGIERAGLLGTGQFAVDAVQGGVGQLAGPSLEQLGSAVQVMAGRGEFGAFALKSMPANALYAEAFRGEPAETTYVE